MQPSLMRVMAGLVLLIASAPAGLAADPPAGTVRYAGFDVAFDGGHLSSGMDVPFGPQGLMVRFTAGTGLSRFRMDPGLPIHLTEITGTTRLMAGWRFTGDWGLATFYAGLGVETRRLSPALPDPAIGTRAGPAIALDAWLKPAERISVQLFATAATPFSAAALRLAPGYEVTTGIHVGPEATLSAHHGTLRTRLGAHVTGLTFGPLGIRLSAGLATDRGGRSGAYGGIALWRSY